MEVLTLDNISYSYINSYTKVDAVKNVSNAFQDGTVYSIMGTSGSGKSTLLSLLGGLDLAQEGDIYYGGKPLRKLDRSKYRRENVSLIYQDYNLIPLMTVAENIMYPMLLNKVQSPVARKKAKEFLLSVALEEDMLGRFPHMLSGGEQQRVAIARALGTSANILLADEPTGNLDKENTKLVMSILTNLAKEKGYCVIIVTHDKDVAGYADVMLTMDEGRMSCNIEY